MMFYHMHLPLEISSSVSVLCFYIIMNVLISIIPAHILTNTHIRAETSFLRQQHTHDDISRRLKHSRYQSKYSDTELSPAASCL